MANYDILPGDKVELRFIGHVTEVQMNDNDDYILTIKIDESSNKRYDSMRINMKTANTFYIKKLQDD